MANVDENAGNSLPKHIAFIMDGNRRWAKKRMLPKSYGHREGAKALKNIVRTLKDMGIPYATFYAFSTENWNRSKDEVEGLMELFDEQLDSLREYAEENVRLIFIGDRSRLSQELIDKMDENERASENNTGMTVMMAINYGGHDEITRAAKRISALSKEGYLDENSITPDLFRSLLDTADAPPVDLLIRPGGEMRLSNFLIWQTAYAELYFCDTLWPDFGDDDLKKAIEVFNSRQRRYGGA